MRRSLLRVALLSLVLLVGFIAGTLTASQPHMTAARQHLRAARHELDLATADKGGHRARALELVDAAIAQVDEGISYDRRH